MANAKTAIAEHAVLLKYTTIFCLPAAIVMLTFQPLMFGWKMGLDGPAGVAYILAMYSLWFVGVPAGFIAAKLHMDRNRIAEKPDRYAEVNEWLQLRENKLNP